MNHDAPGDEQHAEEQRRQWAKLAPLERLRWLQQAKAFAHRYLGAAAKQAHGQASKSNFDN